MSTLSLLGVLSLSACSNVPNPPIETLKFAFSDFNNVIDQTKLNPNYIYLRIAINDLPSVLVLGFVDQDPSGPVQVWYTNERAVLRLQNGRFLGSGKLGIDWQNVRLSHAPAFSDLLGSLNSSTQNHMSNRSYVRLRDEMPGYHFGIRETVNITPLSQMPGNIPSKMRDLLKNKNLVWFAENVDPETSNSTASRPAIYGVSPKGAGANEGEVVFGQQCLAPDYCISWMPWKSP